MSAGAQAFLSRPHRGPPTGDALNTQARGAPGQDGTASASGTESAGTKNGDVPPPPCISAGLPEAEPEPPAHRARPPSARPVHLAGVLPRALDGLVAAGTVPGCP